MGIWYTFEQWSAYGILCEWEGIQGAYEKATSKKGKKKAARKELAQWIATNLSSSFHAYMVHKQFLLITPLGVKPRRLGGVDVRFCGPSDMDEYVISVRKLLDIPLLSVDDTAALTKQARALLGNIDVLDFCPGWWILQSSTYLNIEDIGALAAGQAPSDDKGTSFDMNQKDCQFEVGSDKVKVAVNRAWIASKSDVLYTCVHGTGSIQVDPSSPISMPQFTAEAFKLFVDRLEEVDDVAWDGMGSNIDYQRVSSDVYEEVKTMADFFNVDFLNLCLVSSDFRLKTAFGRECLKDYADDNDGDDDNDDDDDNNDGDDNECPKDYDDDDDNDGDDDNDDYDNNDSDNTDDDVTMIT
jgi:hypothetical protein